MRDRSLLWLPILISALIFILSVVLAWLAGPLLHIEGTSLLILRILLVVLGAAAATVILVMLLQRQTARCGDEK